MKRAELAEIKKRADNADLVARTLTQQNPVAAAGARAYVEDVSKLVGEVTTLQLALAAVVHAYEFGLLEEYQQQGSDEAPVIVQARTLIPDD